MQCLVQNFSAGVEENEVMYLLQKVNDFRFASL